MSPQEYIDFCSSWDPNWRPSKVLLVKGRRHPQRRSDVVHAACFTPHGFKIVLDRFQLAFLYADPTRVLVHRDGVSTLQAAR